MPDSRQNLKDLKFGWRADMGRASHVGACRSCTRQQICYQPCTNVSMSRLPLQQQGNFMDPPPL